MDNMTNYAFVCYAPRDAAQVQPILQGLEERGIALWHHDQPDTLFPAQVAQTLKDSRRVVLMMTPAAVNSPYVRNVVDFALTHDLELLPVLMEEIELPLAMQLRLHNRAFVFRHRFPDEQAFLDCLARLLDDCRGQEQ